MKAPLLKEKQTVNKTHCVLAFIRLYDIYTRRTYITLKEIQMVRRDVKKLKHLRQNNNKDSSSCRLGSGFDPLATFWSGVCPSFPCNGMDSKQVPGVECWGANVCGVKNLLDYAFLQSSPVTGDGFSKSTFIF